MHDCLKGTRINIIEQINMRKFGARNKILLNLKHVLYLLEWLVYASQILRARPYYPNANTIFTTPTTYTLIL